MTLNGVIALILRHFTEFGSFRGALRTRYSSEDQIANVKFLRHKVRKLFHVLTGSSQKFHHAKIRFAGSWIWKLYWV